MGCTRISGRARAACAMAPWLVACHGTPAAPVLTVTGLTEVASVPVPPNYGIHDTYVRDGIAFVCAWNTGVIIYDVGDGRAGGSPANPVELGRVVTAAGLAAGARAHNAWWFHAGATGARRYLFVGQEGPGEIGASSSGDIHVVDVADLSAPVEVATYRMAGTSAPAGTHNFWVDEDAAILYAAYYNGGVVALDVSGTLEGDLTGREIARFAPASDSTYVWGVALHRGTLYLTDMLSGLFAARLTNGAFAFIGGGQGVATERYASDLWASGSHVYTGTWGTRGAEPGNVVNIWRLDQSGRPSWAERVTLSGVGTVGDLQVSADGGQLLVATERGGMAGLVVYGLADPEAPEVIASVTIPDGIHTATLADIGGRRYAFAAKNPPNPALLIFELTP